MDNIKYTRPRAGQVAHVLARIQTPAPVSSVPLLSSNVNTHC